MQQINQSCQPRTLLRAPHVREAGPALARILEIARIDTFYQRYAQVPHEASGTYFPDLTPPNNVSDLPGPFIPSITTSPRWGSVLVGISRFFFSPHPESCGVRANVPSKLTSSQTRELVMARVTLCLTTMDYMDVPPLLPVRQTPWAEQRGNG